MAISLHLADSIIYYLNEKPLNEKEIKKPEDLLEATFTIDKIPYTIVGLIDCGEIPEKYDILQNSTPNNVTTNALLIDYNAYINASAQNCLFVAEGFKDAWKEVNQTAETFYIGNVEWWFREVEETEETEDSETPVPASKKSPTDYVYNANNYDEENILLFKARESGDVSLAENELLIHNVNLINLFALEIAALPTEPTNEKEYARELIKEMEKGETVENRKILEEFLKLIGKDLSSGYIPVTITQRHTQTGAITTTDVKIVGVYFGIDRYARPESYKFMMTDELMQRLNIYPNQGDYNKILFSPTALHSGLDTIVNYVLSESGLSMRLYNNSTLSLIRDNELMIKQVANLFLYAAIALAILSVFLLYNYISTSIARKKQSVGVLRGLGASGKDILLTFLSESLIIAIINGILANVFARFGCSFVNSYIMNVMNVSIQFALFGVRQILIIAAISLATAIVSSALPLVKISRKKPVDLISH